MNIYLPSWYWILGWHQDVHFLVYRRYLTHTHCHDKNVKKWWKVNGLLSWSKYKWLKFKLQSKTVQHLAHAGIVISYFECRCSESQYMFKVKCEDFEKDFLKKIEISTRMLSSRMRTALSREGLCPGSLCPGGSLSRGVCVQGDPLPLL